MSTMFEVASRLTAAKLFVSTLSSCVDNASPGMQQIAHEKMGVGDNKPRKSPET